METQRLALINLIKKLGLESIKDSIYSSSLTKFIDNKLIWLDLGVADLVSLKGDTFDEFPDLEYLGLYANKFVTLPENLFNNLKKLKYLDLGENQLNQLPLNLFASQSYSLLYLWLYRNKLAGSNLDFLKHLDLKELDLNSNGLTEFDFSCLSTMNNLTRIGLVYNDFTSFPEYNKDKLPHLQELLINKLKAGGKNFVFNLLQSETPEIDDKVKNLFCLVTGSMGSGKSSVISQNKLVKTSFKEPESPKKLYFDHIFGYQYNQQAVINFYELDGPTITYWKNFVNTSDGVLVLIRDKMSEKYYLDTQKLLVHILNNLRPNAPLVICYNEILIEDPHLHLKQLLPNLELTDVPVYLVPPGEIVPSLGGITKVILDNHFTDKVFTNACKLIFQNSSLSV